MFLGKKCVYCNGRSVSVRDGRALCGSCGRENKPLQPISILSFEPVGEEHLTLLRQRKCGILEKMVHDKILSAADEDRLLIAPAISDGFYKWQGRGTESFEEDQFLRSMDGTPIEGRANMSGRLVNEGKPVYVILLITKNGRRCYEVISEAEYGLKGEKLAQTLVDIEFSILPLGGYDSKRRITI